MKVMILETTLQDLILDKIVLEFSRYYQAYCSTEDSCLKLKLEFLKKKYSFHIVRNLDAKNLLKTEYLDFLINKYLKMLDTRWLKEWSWETVSQKLAEIGPNLEEIIFSDRPWENILRYLPNMKKVYFQLSCTDEFLVHLSKFCGSVEVLDVSYSKCVSDSGLQNLCCVRGPSHNYVPMKELYLEHTEVGKEGVVYVLKNMPNLQKLGYRRFPAILCSMHKSDINAIDKVKPYNLTHLDLMCFQEYSDMYNDICTVCISMCPFLKFLSFRVLQKQHLDLCSQLQDLETLQLYWCKASPMELNELLTLNWKKLTSLSIYNFCISLSVLAQNCPHLNLLHMDKVNFQHNVNDSIPAFHKLKIISFDSLILIEPVNSQAVTCLLASAPNLKQLRFNGCKSKLFPSDIKTQILRCCEQCKLNCVDFTFSDVEFALLKDILLTCSTLKYLCLKGSDIAGEETMYELEMIADSLPNEPQLTVVKQITSLSCYDTFSMMNDYEYYCRAQADRNVDKLFVF